MRAEQISMLPLLSDGEDADDIIRQVELLQEYAKKKRKWENAFQKWSNLGIHDESNGYGICGFGSICGYCKDNTYGRPCVRALNALMREKGRHVDYSDVSEEAFERAWFL